MKKNNLRYTPQQLKDELLKITAENKTIGQQLKIPPQQAKENILAIYPKAEAISFAYGQIKRIVVDINDHDNMQVLASAENEMDAWLFAYAFYLNNTPQKEIKASEKRILASHKIEARAKRKKENSAIQLGEDSLLTDKVYDKTTDGRTCIEDKPKIAMIFQSDSDLTNSNIQQLLDSYVSKHGIYALETLLQKALE